MQSSDKWKLAFLFLLALIIVAANIWTWYFFAKSKSSSDTSEIVKTQTATYPANPLSPTGIPPSPITDETAAIKKAMAEKLGKNENSLDINISKNTGQYAKGTVKEKAETGGGYFLSVKKGGKWIIVYDGQSQPPCKDMEAYNFPKDLAPECLSDKGQVVKR